MVVKAMRATIDTREPTQQTNTSWTSVFTSAVDGSVAVTVTNKRVASDIKHSFTFNRKVAVNNSCTDVIIEVHCGQIINAEGTNKFSTFHIFSFLKLLKSVRCRCKNRDLLVRSTKGYFCAIIVLVEVGPVKLNVK
jgi:hypothetical protein